MLAYPPDNYSTDSKTIFFLGSAKSSCKINGEPVRLYENSNFCHIVPLKLGDNTVELDIDGKIFTRNIKGVKPELNNPIAYARHYESFPAVNSEKANVLRSIIVKKNQIIIPLNTPPMYELETVDKFNRVLDLFDIDMDLDWLHYEDIDPQIVMEEIRKPKFSDSFY